MIKLLRIVKSIIIFGVLTLFTQIGGLIYLLLKPIAGFITRNIQHRRKKQSTKLAFYFAGYLLIIGLLVPPIAKKFGREPLPVFGHQQIQPLNVWTCLLNRHYVRSTLRQTMVQVAKQLNQAHPGTVIAYMDANFPFKKGYPLWPHLSHSDGKKIDIAFLYQDPKTGQKLSRTARTLFGYASYETPKPHEYNIARECKKQGFRQYNLLGKLYPEWLKKRRKLDLARTRTMVQLFAQHPQTQVLYIEPYLKQRWRVFYPKIRFHGCHSIRHDDHIHLGIW
ncbi:MAG TPA: hypothetical protein DCS93_43375 [Microscillaceae bacterium]|nr:hypothetical protein [Microscillaceae bacterium]